MPRKKGSKNKQKSESDNIKPEPEKKEPELDDPRLPDKTLFRTDEVADYFNVHPRTIRTWIDHGHLVAYKTVGTIQITRDSILRCRFRKLVIGPNL